MSRLLLALALLCLAQSVALAAVTTSPPRTKTTKTTDLDRPARKQATSTPATTTTPATVPADELELTLRSEVRLNGQLIDYKAIPQTAVITYVELAPNGRTILKIHFRSR